MEYLKKILAVLQQHWEKAALGLALVSLAVAGLLLAQQRAGEEQKLTEYEGILKTRRPFPYTNINWTLYREALSYGTNPVSLNLAAGKLHYIFSPVKWYRRPDGSLFKIETGSEIGSEALRVTKIAPLYLTISMDAPNASGFMMTVTKENDPRPQFRGKPIRSRAYMNVGGKDSQNTFLLKAAKGTNDEAQLEIELLDTNEKVVVTKEKPFRRVDGYKADLSYPPENKSFSELRLNDKITLQNEDYNIVAISQNEVVISARNNKRTTIRYNAAP